MKIAVVGGGITGSVVASELARVFGSKSGGIDGEVVLFDQGRRGPGGRASHRSVIKKPRGSSSNSNANGKNVDDEDVEKEEFEVLPDDEIDDSAFQFDHGCQFFRADSPSMKRLVETWLQRGWIAPWKARFGSLPQSYTNDGDETTDFFGLPASSSGSSGNEDVYIGVGGMHLLPRKILEFSDARVHRGARVSGVARRETQPQHPVWDLTTTVGAAAFHDTKESEATAGLERATKEEQGVGESDTAAARIAATATATTTRVIVHRGFDAVVFTDISSSSDSWHRASAGIPPGFAARLPPKLRLPLFSCMIALETPLRDTHTLPFDAFAVANPSSKATSTSTSTSNITSNITSNSDSPSPLWFAAVSDSKPGFPKGATECWTLISTPSFAVEEIQQTTMRDPVTGAFRPQENDYLNSVPGPALRDAFFDLIEPYRKDKNNNESLSPRPRTLYLQGQRWGSGLPIDPNKVAPEHTEEICGTTYASKVRGSLVYSNSTTPSSPRKNFVADDALGLYYGGDFCSHLNPGFEAAALSGFDLAKHILHLKKVILND